MAERVGPDNLRLAMTAGSEFCSPLLDTRVRDSKGQGYRRQQVLKPCACQQARFLERNLGIGEKAFTRMSGTSNQHAASKISSRSKVRMAPQMTWRGGPQRECQRRSFRRRWLLSGRDDKPYRRSISPRTLRYQNVAYNPKR